MIKYYESSIITSKIKLIFILVETQIYNSITSNTIQLYVRLKFIKYYFKKNSMVLSDDFIQMAINNPYVKCIDLHQTSCNIKFFQQFLNGVRSMYKIYLIAHLLPLILFKRKALKQNFKKQLIKLITGYIKSLCFCGFYSAGVRRTLCFLTEHWGYHGIIAGISGFFPGIALIFQSQGRQAQIALYTVNKSLQTIFYEFKRRKYLNSIKYGEAILFGISMSIIGYYYMNNEQDIKKSYLTVFKKFLGEV